MTSTYLLDLHAMTAQRLAGPPTSIENGWVAADLRGDRQTIPLLAVPTVQVGHPLVLLLDVRGDGIPTVRTSTPVQAITAIPDDERPE